MAVLHKSINMTPRNYVQASGRILVRSVFKTLQGEGPFAGHPAMFVRLAGCNYGLKDKICTFCDTDFDINNAEYKSPEDLLKSITARDDYTPNLILVITGGEPTLQIAVLDFINKAVGHFSRIQLETNGTQYDFFEQVEARQLGSSFVTVVSPKANEVSRVYPALHPKVLWYAQHLKFLLSANPDSVYYEVPKWVTKAHVVWVSPITVYKSAFTGAASIWEDHIDKEASRANYEYAAQYAIKHNLKLSLQTHLFTSIA